MSGKLRVRKAVLAGIVLSCSAVTAHAETWLKAADITYIFAGREVTGIYQNGAQFTEIYRGTGKIEYRDDANTASGKWSVTGDQFCTLYDGQPGGCYKIRLVSQNCFEYWLVKPDAAVDATWIARSWQTKYPSTCPAFTPSPS